jgi:hypothetical protein
MTLLLPAPPAFGYFVTNEDSPTGGAFGTSVTAGTANIKGTWAAIHATISYDLYYHTITFTEGAVSTVSTRIFCDLGVGPDSSNVTQVAENLDASNAAPHTQGGRVLHGFPLYIPAGTQLWARVQSNTASQTVRVHISSWGAPDHPESFPKISYIESIGDSTATTTGTAITAGASGALGTATSMGGGFTNNVSGVSMSIGSDDASLGSVGYLGAVCTDATATVQELGIACDHKVLGTTEQVRSNASPIWCDIPAGQTMSARISCNGTSDSTMWAILYGFVRG